MRIFKTAQFEHHHEHPHELGGIGDLDLHKLHIDDKNVEVDPLDDGQGLEIEIGGHGHMDQAPVEGGDPSGSIGDIVDHIQDDGLGADVQISVDPDMNPLATEGDPMSTQGPDHNEEIPGELGGDTSFLGKGDDFGLGDLGDELGGNVGGENGGEVEGEPADPFAEELGDDFEGDLGDIDDFGGEFDDFDELAEPEAEEAHPHEHHEHGGEGVGGFGPTIPLI